jgi:plastocyanin
MTGIFTSHPSRTSVTRSRLLALAAVIMAGLVPASCGGGGGGNSSGGPTAPTPDPGPPVATTTITITASGANPRSISIQAGQRVTFINNDARQHDMNSDPHPDHTDCPAINQVGFLSPGQQRETGNLNTPRTCGFHDHDQPNNGALTGRIIIQ